MERELIVGTQEGTEVLSLATRLPSVAARFRGVLSERWCVVRVFSGDVNHAIARIQDWPEVRVVAHNSVISTGIGPPPPARFSGALPLDDASPIPDDGRLQVRAGDVIILEYRQPDGSTHVVEKTVTPPAESVFIS